MSAVLAPVVDRMKNIFARAGGCQMYVCCVGFSNPSVSRSVVVITCFRDRGGIALIAISYCRAVVMGCVKKTV